MFITGALNRKLFNFTCVTLTSPVLLSSIDWDPVHVHDHCLSSCLIANVFDILKGNGIGMSHNNLLNSRPRLIRHPYFGSTHTELVTLCLRLIPLILQLTRRLTCKVTYSV